MAHLLLTLTLPQTRAGGTFRVSYHDVMTKYDDFATDPSVPGMAALLAFIRIFTQNHARLQDSSDPCVPDDSMLDWDSVKACIRTGTNGKSRHHSNSSIIVKHDALSVPFCCFLPSVMMPITCYEVYFARYRSDHLPLARRLPCAMACPPRS